MSERISTDGLDLGLLHQLVGYHLRRASNVVTSDFLLTLAGTGLRQVPFAVLSVIHANPGVSQGVVARALGIQRANIVSLINELLEKGLVRREASANDRRAYRLYLSERGKQLFAESSAAIVQHEDAILASLTAKERETLIRLLACITDREDEID